MPHLHAMTDENTEDSMSCRTFPATKLCCYPTTLLCFKALPSWQS